MSDIKKAYHLIVFDWQGTLYDFADQVLHCLKKSANDVKEPMFDEEEYRSIAGLPANSIIDALYSDVSESIRSNIKARYQLHALLDKNAVPLFPDAKATLSTLKNKGYMLAIATGASEKGLTDDLLNTQLTGFFDVIRTADKTASKPNPLMLQQIIEVASVSPQKALMVGDSIHDIQMANNAGVDSVAIHSDSSQRNFLLSQGATTSVATLTELLSFLGVE